MMHITSLILVVLCHMTLASPLGLDPGPVIDLCCPYVRIPNCGPNAYAYVTPSTTVPGCPQSGCLNCDFDESNCFPCPAGHGGRVTNSGCFDCQCVACPALAQFNCRPGAMRSVVRDSPGACPRATCMLGD
jgi:hypothetical protein